MAAAAHCDAPLPSALHFKRPDHCILTACHITIRCSHATAPRCRYGTPQPFVSAFAPSRGGGEAAFGILEWGGCGYTNSDGGKGQVPLPKEAVGAYSDKNEDSAGGGRLLLYACGVTDLLLDCRMWQPCSDWIFWCWC